jgi:hypothetical protein
MPSLEALIESGRIVDLMLAVLVLECAALWVVHRRTGRGIAPAALIANLGAGGSLMLALRAALTGAAWPAVAAFLLGSLFFHAADQVFRWHRPRSSGGADGRA